MPAPAVYVVIAVGVVVTGFALKEFVIPHVKPRVEQMFHELEARSRARRQRRRHAPLAADNASARDGGLPRAPSSHELQRMDHDPPAVAASSGIEVNAQQSLRSRVNLRGSSHTLDSASPPQVEGLIDSALNENDIQAPIDPVVNPWASSSDRHSVLDVSSASFSPSQSYFQLGSETPTVASETPPRSRFLSIDATDAHSRSSLNGSPSPSQVQVQLPTPSPSPSPVSPAHAPHAMDVSRTLLGPDASEPVLEIDENHLAPGVSRTTTTTMADSYFTANSPGTEFRSLPATEPTSPRTEASFISAEDDDMTLASMNSSDSLAFVPGSTHPLDESSSPDPVDDPFEDPFSGFTSARRSSGEALTESEWDSVRGSSSTAPGSDHGNSDDEGSSNGSWQDITSPPTSPRI